MTSARFTDTRRTVSWALYDWANSAFATAVMAAFFPLFFRDYWSVGEPSASTFRLGLANSASSLIIVALAPVLGAIADRGSARKRLLAVFATVGILMTAALGFVGAGRWELAAALYVLAVVGFSGANVFYDSLLVNVADDDRVDFVSSLGFGLGYLGGGLLFAMTVWMVQAPHRFGLADPAAAMRVSFLLVAVWWALFSLPLWAFVPETKASRRLAAGEAIAAGFRQLRGTFRRARELRGVGLFLVGYWLYIDGVDTVVRMAADYGRSIGFAPGDLVLALLLTQFVAFPAALGFGVLGKRIGPKRGILIALSVYVAASIWAYFMTRPIEFYGLAVAIGLVQGGVQALSRSLYARLIPRTQAAEFFGFYNMAGKLAAVIGPALMGVVTLATGNPRLGILAILPLFVVGGAILTRVDVEATRRASAVFDRPA